MAMDGHMMRLGGFTFQIGTAAYTKLTRQDNWRWVKQDRLDNFPAEQLVGPGQTEVSLEGVVFTAYNPGGGAASNLVGGAVGTQQIEAIRAVARSGEPQMLVDGRGNVMGKFVIKTVRQEDATFLSNGAPRQQSFTVELASYGDDNDGAGAFGGLLGSLLGGGIGSAIDSALSSALGGGITNAVAGINDAFQSLAGSNLVAAQVATVLTDYGIAAVPAAQIGVDTNYLMAAYPQAQPVAGFLAKRFGAVYALPPVQYRYAVNRMGELFAAGDWIDANDVVSKAMPVVDEVHDLLGIAMNEAAAVTLALAEVPDTSVNRGAYLLQVGEQMKRLLAASETARISLDIDMEAVYAANSVQRYSTLLRQLYYSRMYHTAQFNTFFPSGQTAYFRALLDNFSAFEAARIGVYPNIPTGIVPVALTVS